MLEEIRERSKGINGSMPDANKAEIHRRDCVALLSLVDKYKEALNTIKKHPMPDYHYCETYFKIKEIATKALVES